MKLRLLWKLVLINFLVVLVVVAVVDAALRVLAADYFLTLVKEYNIAPEEAHEMFLEAVERYLLGAGAVACAVAVALVFWMTRRTLRPLTAVMRSARQIAAGDYSARVDETNCGEIGELATTFNRMVESFVHAERLRKDMVANVAHELRTPLTNIRGYLEALIDTVMEPSPEVLTSLHDETLRLVKLVEDLLQLARADAARTNLHLEAVHLKTAVLQTLELFQLKFAAKEIALSTDLDPADVTVRADADKLTQILTNLYENAWRYTRHGGRTSVAAVRLPNAVKVTVANTPEGDVQAAAAPVFERFHRDEKSRSRDYGGAGIGLAIVKELVESHGGAVGAEVVGDEKRVWFTWPAGELQSPARTSF